MTREKYESLPLATLKELAKARKMKGVSTLKKADLIEAMISLDEQEDQEKLSEQKESSQEHLKEMQNQNREEKAASELKENKEHREAKDKKPETDMEQLGYHTGTDVPYNGAGSLRSGKLQRYFHGRLIAGRNRTFASYGRRTYDGNHAKEQKRQDKSADSHGRQRGRYAAGKADSRSFLP